MKAGRVDRREFIKGAAGAAAISTLPHQVFGLSTGLAMLFPSRGRQAQRCPKALSIRSSSL